MSVRMQRLVPMLPVRSMPDSVQFYRRMLGFEVAPRQTVLYLYPDDVVRYHAQVRQNGLPAPDLRITFYGMKEFRIRDPDGNELWIGQVT